MEGEPSVGIVGALLQDSNPPIEIGVGDADQGSQRVVRARDLLSKSDFDAVDPREPLGEETDVASQALRHDVEVPARLDGRRVDVPPQVNGLLLETIEPLIRTDCTLVQTGEAPIDLLDAPIDLVQALIDAIQALVDTVEALVDVLAQRVERCSKLGIHGVILLQSSEYGIGTASR